ncbi:MAG TPA: glycoside hydrolase family 6 protein [Candidatus Saccharimonadales bacterium]|nr:glycoside hydrolase family 6 protein [Candidatus Saccharimonadales bacterium]
MRTRKNTSEKTRIALLAAAIAVLLLVGGFFVVKYITSGQAGGLFSGGNNPLKDVSLFVDPNSKPAVQAAAWRGTQPENAALMDKLAAQPTARWSTYAGDFDALSQYVQAAAASKKTPVLVSYFFPKRDCGRYSTGGARDGEEYKGFIDGFANTIGTARAIVILEPDAIPNIKALDDQGKPCLSDEDQQLYYSLMDYAVTTLKSQSNISLYIDAGNSQWIKDTNETANRLKRASIAKADGFSLNVSNFQTTDDTIAYGEAISRAIDGKHFVIDTSRNGNGPFTNPAYPSHGWCNPPDRALGHYPTTQTGHGSVDAYLYIKRPGESDGADADPQKCFGGPKAGDWWPDYAAGLVARWPKELQPN